MPETREPHPESLVFSLIAQEQRRKAMDQDLQAVEDRWFARRPETRIQS